jgi:hypothetical protein
MLLSVFDEVLGSDQIPVDSSKSLGAMQLVASVENIDLKIVHLIRDVRGWSVSRREVDKRLRQRGLEIVRAQSGDRLWLYYLQQIAIIRFMIWYRGNLRINKYIKERDLSAIQTSYESLAFRGEATTHDLCSFLGLQLEQLTTQIETSKSHIALGNPMRLEPSRRKRIDYDYRWLARRDWMLASVLLPHIMTYNQRTVYGEMRHQGNQGPESRTTSSVRRIV